MGLFDRYKKNKELEEQQRKLSEKAQADFIAKLAGARAAAEVLAPVVMDKERDSWEENDVGVDPEDFDNRDDYIEAVNAQKGFYWKDNEFGVNKSDFEYEDEYMDAVREHWPDNDVDVDKEDYDTLEDYLEAIEEEKEF